MAESLWSLVSDSFHNHSSCLAIKYIDDESATKSTRLTYSDLWHDSEIILRELSVEVKRSPVGLLFGDDSSDMLPVFPAIIATVRCGRAFFYMTDEKDEESLRNWTITTVLSTQSLTPSSRSFQVRHLNIFITEYSCTSQHEKGVSHSNYDLAYIVTTSGSTGQPKPVYVRNSSVVPNIRDFIRIFATEPGDEILAASPLSFDPSLVDLFLALATGATLLVLPRRLKFLPSLYSILFVHNKVSVLQCTPGLLVRIFLGDRPMSPPSLRIVGVGGERASAEAGDVLMRLVASGVQVFHLYGLTEMSVWQSMLRITSPEDATRPPIYIRGGNLLSETTISCDDENDKGGEVVVSSLTRHCCQRPCTTTCICQPPFTIWTGDLAVWKENRLYWHGRSDNVLKIQGTKVCIEQVECCLSVAFSTPVACCAAAAGSGITAYVQQTAHLKEWDVSDLLERSRQVLASAEVPRKFVFVTSFPLSHHGKLDRRRLGQLDGLAVGPSASVTTPVQLVAHLWHRLLGRTPRETDSFLSAGGDSFLAVALAQSVRDAFPSTPPNLLDKLLSVDFQAVEQLLHAVDNDTGQPASKRFKLIEGKPPYFSSKYSSGETSNETAGSAVALIVHRSKGRQSLPRPPLSLPARTGVFKLKWKVDFEKCIDSSPLYVTTFGGQQEEFVVVGSHSGWVKSVCCNSGRQLWATRLPDRVEASPSCDESGEKLLVGCYDWRLYCLEMTSGRILWYFQTQAVVKCSALVERGAVYVGSHDHWLYKLNMRGEMLWQVKPSEGSLYASPVTIPPGVLCATLDGCLVAIHSESAAVLWSSCLGQPLFTTPAYCPGRHLLLVGCVNRTFYAVSAEDGKTVWQFSTGAPLFSSPVLYGEDRVLFGCHDRHLYLLEAGSGHLVWQSQLDAEIFASADFETAGGRILAATTKGTVYIVSCQGEIVSSFQLSGHLFSSPIFLPGQVIVGSRDNFLYCYEEVDLPN